MRFASLGSGSRGNATLVACGATTIMLDAGFSLRETEARLARLGVRAAELSAILVTHEHDDHIRGVGAIARRYRLPVWMTAGTWAAGRALFGSGVRIEHFNPHVGFAIGEIAVQPFPVPHDAREPAQFVFGDGAQRLGVLTDVGVPTAHIEAMLSGCCALLIECNHDPELLWGGEYPPRLKERIASDYGHLANEAAAALIARLDRSRLRQLVAAHLSQKNNTPARVRACLSRALGCEPEWIGIADQDRGSPWHTLSAPMI